MSLFTVNNDFALKSSLNNPEVSLGSGNSNVINKGNLSVGIGFQAGRVNQSTNAIAIGVNAGTTNQGQNSIAIGVNAGFTNQASFAIAIGVGAGITSQTSNSIILNASATPLNSATNGFFVNPLRTFTTDTTSRVLVYNTSTLELLYSTSNAGSTTKTFVIQHPEHEDKYLVHGCLEGPEVGVYYRGESSIEEGNTEVEVSLPSYVSKLAHDLSVQVTAIFDGEVKHYAVSKVVDNKFKVHGKSGSFFWNVHGKRNELDVEVHKSRVQLQSVGPYTWLV